MTQDIDDVMERAYLPCLSGHLYTHRHDDDGRQRRCCRKDVPKGNNCEVCEAEHSLVLRAYCHWLLTATCEILREAHYIGRMQCQIDAAVITETWC